MSLALIQTRALDSLQAPPVTVGVLVANGLPTFSGRPGRRRGARTIADLGGADHISAAHIAEAIQFRQLFSNP